MDRSSNHWPLAIALALPLAIGCGDSGGAATKDSGVSMDDLLDQQADSDAQRELDKDAATARDEANALQAEADRLANQSPSVVTTDDMEEGKRTKKLGSGILTTPLAAGFTAKQKLSLFQVTHALNLYWGAEGRYPKSHDEFMEKVIEANQIVLPPLQEPYEYQYNPEDHQLYKRVKQEAIDAANAEAAAKEAAAE